MKAKFLILFSIALLVLVPVHVASAQDDWLSIEDEHFVVKYKQGYRSDAELMLEYSQYARNITIQIYPHELDTKVTVLLYDLASWTKTPYYASADPANAMMSFLTPSDVPAYAEEVDNLWYQKNVVHEYAHIPTLRDLRATTHYRNFGAPTWLIEGTVEYIAVFRTTDQIRQEYSYYGSAMLATLSVDSLFLADYNLYSHGAYVMKYVYETYGDQKTALLFKTDAEFLWDAVNQALGVSRPQFEQNWIEWVYGEFDLDVPVEYLETEVLETLYNELKQDYDHLDDDFDDNLDKYQQLETQYSTLLEDLASLQAQKDTLQSAYDSLNSSYETLQTEKSLLQSNYTSLQTENSTIQGDYDSLNTTHEKLLTDYEDLQKTVDSLQGDYDKLLTDYNTVKSDLESTATELETTKNEMTTNTNLMIGLVATVAFVPALGYYVIRKRKLA